jgi:pyridinium-3,5-bisthiocarboxylic acid mononucleotide nickel chelatase
MCLGALVHAGVPLDYLIEQLHLLGISGEYQLQSELVHRNGQQATKVHVHLLHQDLHQHLARADTDEPIAAVDPHSTFTSHRHPNHAVDIQSSAPDPEGHEAIAPFAGDSTAAGADTGHAHGTRHLPDIEHLITTAELPSRVKEWSLAIFRRLAVAEGAVHGIAPEQVHFHEVGATDAIVDIVGTCLGLDWLEIDQLYCSALPTGGGTVRAAHGQLPVPTPAVLKLWEMRQVPIYSNGIERELVTPTGAAIATTLAIQFGAPPPMTLQKVGLGAGSRNLPIPNLLRLWIGEGKHTGIGLLFQER